MATFKTVLTILVVLLRFSSICLSQSDTTAGVAAAKAWEGLVTAKGGRDRIYAVKNLLTIYPSQNVVSLDVIPDLTWKFGGPFYGSTRVSIVDRKRDVLLLASSNGMRETTAKFDRDWYQSRRFALILEPGGEKPELLRVRRDSRKLVQDILEVRLGRTRLDLYFEPEEMLINRLDALDQRGVPYETYLFREYKNLEGIMMPMQFAVVFDPQSHPKAEPSYMKMNYEFNVAYNPDIFVSPEKYISPDGWKPKRTGDKAKN